MARADTASASDVHATWGGFFDHVAPQRVPDQRNDPDINNDYGLMGFRIPTIAVSPEAVRAHEHDLLDLVTSGYLERLGFDYRPASAASTFREPSKVVGSLLP